MANELKAKQETSLALFGNDVSKGFENMTQEDMALPFVRILGQLSPQVTDGDAKYIEGAKPGMIYNTVTSELYDGKKGIKVIPCYYKKDYPEWSDRGDGPGAPVAIHLPNRATDPFCLAFISLAIIHPPLFFPAYFCFVFNP